MKKSRGDECGKTPWGHGDAKGGRGVKEDYMMAWKSQGWITTGRLHGNIKKLRGDECTKTPWGHEKSRRDECRRTTWGHGEVRVNLSPMLSLQPLIQPIDTLIDT